ncbi:50S ribosomal protein L22 [Thermocladium modestius]|uniref:Large ribosomal subunit protein uL22 n=1 Tax=Thermocladium modestius TaxID=62609 RepID=A0A830GWX2_9CREN|nr:50S ribosomal protein L22 [Thermocladium modestius]GGP21464.1 50S ribosomal protein L22 [Thermocladium modestius]
MSWSASYEDLIELVRRRFGASVGEDQIVRARATFRISWKSSIDVARAIRGLTVEQAKQYLNDVAAGRVPVPVKGHDKKRAHHPVPWRGWPAARWPRKAALAYLELLESLEGNCTYKGLNTSNAVIIHASSSKGAKIPGYMPRAFGRSSPWNNYEVNVEIAAAELPEELVPKKLSHKRILKNR